MKGHNNKIAVPGMKLPSLTMSRYSCFGQRS